MARTEEAPESQGMKIARLCAESGLTRSTIHHCVNIGILHRPRRAGLNLYLFDETHFGPVELKNRIALAPMNEIMSGVDGEATEQMLSYCAARAKGGAGLISTEC